MVLRNISLQKIKTRVPTYVFGLCGSALFGTVVLCAVSDDNSTSKHVRFLFFVIIKPLLTVTVSANSYHTLDRHPVH